MTKYSDSIQQKLLTLRGSEDTGLAGLSKSVDRLVHNLDKQVAANQGARPVQVVPAEATTLERIDSALTPLLEPLARSVVVLVLVIFLLIKREDLRDRFIRLGGRGNLSLTTRTLDEAAHRISRFLAHQSAINGGFGLLVALGLAGIGIPYAPLWGVTVAVLRFVPFWAPCSQWWSQPRSPSRSSEAGGNVRRSDCSWASTRWPPTSWRPSS